MGRACQGPLSCSAPSLRGFGCGPAASALAARVPSPALAPLLSVGQWGTTLSLRKLRPPSAALRISAEA
eukprot:7251356-Heterocapsa_arctica.AAC.1